MPITNFDEVYVGGVPLTSIVQNVLTAFVGGAQTTGALKWQWLVPVEAAITAVQFWLETPPDTEFVGDLLKNGVSVFTTPENRPTIAAGESASTVLLPDILSIAAGDRLSLSVVTIGTPGAGADLSAAVMITRV